MAKQEGTETPCGSMPRTGTPLAARTVAGDASGGPDVRETRALTLARSIGGDAFGGAGVRETRTESIAFDH